MKMIYEDYYDNASSLSRYPIERYAGILLSATAGILLNAMSGIL